MSLRVKLILALTLLAAAATATINITSYTSTKHQLESSVDASLVDAAARFIERPEMGDPDHDGDEEGAHPRHGDHGEPHRVSRRPVGLSQAGSA